MTTETRPWWKDAVFYEIFSRSFKDSNGDGDGDLRGVIEKLDYFSFLGVDALWLTPIFQSPWRDSGYDVSDYDLIDPSMGSMADFLELIERAGEHGLRIILDLVINHTSDQHAWFLESRSSLSNARRDFYIWRPANNGAEPNNWKSLVGGSVWEWDEVTGEYYLHLFSKYQPDLNWANPAVKEAVFSSIKGWLDKGVAGFRMDVINCLMKPPGLPDAHRGPGDHEKYVLDRALYADNPGMHELLHDLRRTVLDPYDAFAIGEVHFNTPEMAALYVDPSREELDVTFQTDLLFGSKTPEFIAKRITAWSKALDGKGWNGFCLGNHDTPRQVSTIGDDGFYRTESAKAIAALCLTCPGSPFIFEGDELGMTNVSFPTIEDYRDIEMKSFYAEKIEAGMNPPDALQLLRPTSRDNARTPMQWSTTRNAGFTSGTPWIGLNPGYEVINAEMQQQDQESVLHFYRRLVLLRREHPALTQGDFEEIDVGHSKVIAYVRTVPGEVLFVLVNLSSERIELPQGDLSTAMLLLGNYPGDDSSPGLLRPWETRILVTAKGSQDNAPAE